MGTTADKLNKVLESKAAIKAAIEAKGVTDVGDVLSAYPEKIASIPTGGGSTNCIGFTGHADVEGLKAIGWTDGDIEYYQNYGVDWNEEDDALHKVPEDNIALYGVLTVGNIQDYKDILVYCPKINTTGKTSFIRFFANCTKLVAIPTIDTSMATSMFEMFSGSPNITCIPPIDTSKIADLAEVFDNLLKLYSIASLNFKAFSTLFAPVIINSPNLQHLYITNFKNMHGGIVSILSTVLSRESLLFIINNEAATTSATLKLSSVVYNKYSNDPDVLNALAAHPNIKLASA